MSAVSLLTPDNLDALRRWRYDIVDDSITTKLFTPFWNRAVLYFPEHVPANVITLVGLLLCYFSAYITYNPGHVVLTGFWAGWPSFLAALCIFAYQTLDALDG